MLPSVRKQNESAIQSSSSSLLIVAFSFPLIFKSKGTPFNSLIITPPIQSSHFHRALQFHKQRKFIHHRMGSIDADHDFFPDEIIIQILARLPLKSLFRFRSVCKLWHRLASDRYFIQLFNNVSIKNPMVLIEVNEMSESKSSLVCVDYSTGASDYSLKFLQDRVRVRASCNGLLCCSSVPDKGVYYVCNPITRQFKLLPRFRERPVTRFHPDGEATLVGIACDLSGHKFNVVLAGYQRRFSHSPDGTFMCAVYDSESNRWRKFVSLQEDHFTLMNKNQVVYSNRALHWLTDRYTYILALDLDKDVWRRIHLPDYMFSGSGRRMYLLEANGCVSVIQIADSWMSIWVLKDYELEQWEMVDKVSLGCIRELVPGMYPISQTGRFVFLATHKQILVYVRNTRVWKELYSVKNSSLFPLCFSAFAFRGTISPC